MELKRTNALLLAGQLGGRDMTTVRVPITAATGKGESRKEKTLEFDCPAFDAKLESLLAFYKNDAKALYRDWLDKVSVIDMQAKVRRAIEAEAGVKTKNNGNGVHKALGL